MYVTFWNLYLLDHHCMKIVDLHILESGKACPALHDYMERSKAEGSHEVWFSF